MINLIKLFAFILLASTFSCSDDEDDMMVCTDFNETIIGDWTCSACGMGDVTFESDGTLLDPDGVLIEGEIGGETLDDKTWTSDGTELELRAESPGGQFIAITPMIVNVSCDVVTLSILDIDFDLRRK